jgi:hypothetical protein
MRKRNQSMFESLAQAVAAGQTIKAWAAKHHQAYRTCRGWAATPEFKAAVAELRSISLDTYIGRITAAMDILADKMLEIATTSASDSARVAAIRGAVSDLISVTGLAEVKDAIRDHNARLDRIEKGPTNGK